MKAERGTKEENGSRYFGEEEAERRSRAKEKERKQRRIEDAQWKQREHEERLCAEKEVKELRRKIVREKELRRKYLADEEVKRQLKSEKGRKLSGFKKVTEVEPGYGVLGRSDMEANDTFKRSNNAEKEEKSFAELQITIQDRRSFTKGSQDMKSYKISPYKDSDDEDGEDDSRHKRKYIPPWARRECLDQLLLSM